MKYLKKYNESESQIQSFFKPLINHNLINDLKEMIVDLLDKEWILYLSVRCDGLNGQKVSSHLQNQIMRIVHGIDYISEFPNNDMDKFRREYVAGKGQVLYNIFDEYESNGLNYVFSISKRISSSRSSVNLDISEEILQDIRSLYPNEKIDLDLNFYDDKEKDQLFDINTKTNFGYD